MAVDKVVLTELDLNRDTFETTFRKLVENDGKVIDYVEKFGIETHEEVFIAEEGQTEFFLIDKFEPKSNSLVVSLDNVVQVVNEGYIETSDKSFRFSEPLVAGQTVKATYFEPNTRSKTVYIGEQRIDGGNFTDEYNGDTNEKFDGLKDLIQVTTGSASDVDRLYPRELGFADDGELYIGGKNGKAIKMTHKSEVGNAEELVTKSKVMVKAINEMYKILNDTKEVLDSTVKDFTDSINSEVERISHKLGNIIDTRYGDYEGESIIIEDSLRGYAKDLIIEGSTLQNLNNFSLSNTTKDDEGYYTSSVATYDYLSREGKVLLNPSTTYTIVVEVVENNLSVPLNFNSTNYWSKQIKICNSNQKGVFKFLNTTKTSFEGEAPYPIWIVGGSPQTTTGGFKLRFMILEGDWTNKEVPSYFEGIKSVGQEESKINVISHGKNLIPSEILDKGTRTKNGVTITVEEGKETTYEPYKQDKKTFVIPFSEGLKSIKNVRDEVNCVTNKVIQRVGKYVITGNENIALWSNYGHEWLADRDVVSFAFNLPLAVSTKNSDVICNNFRNSEAILWDVEKTDHCYYTNTKETIHVYYANASTTNMLGISILKSKLGVTEENWGNVIPLIKQWLRENPTVVYYELAEPIEYDLRNKGSELQTFTNKTYISLEDDIKGNIKIKIPKTLATVVEQNFDNILGGVGGGTSDKKTQTLLNWLIASVDMSTTETYNLELTDTDWKSYEFPREFDDIPKIEAYVLNEGATSIPIIRNLTTKGFVYKNDTLGNLVLTIKEER